MTRRRFQTFLLWYNAAQLILWLALVAPSLLWWRNSIAWVVFMSVYANVAGAIAGLTSALVARQVEGDE